VLVNALQGILYIANEFKIECDNPIPDGDFRNLRCVDILSYIRYLYFINSKIEWPCGYYSTVSHYVYILCILTNSRIKQNGDK
jgi:hypothetical protein